MTIVYQRLQLTASNSQTDDSFSDSDAVGLVF